MPAPIAASGSAAVLRRCARHCAERADKHGARRACKQAAGKAQRARRLRRTRVRVLSAAVASPSPLAKLTRNPDETGIYTDFDGTLTDDDGAVIGLWLLKGKSGK